MTKLKNLLYSVILVLMLAQAVALLVLGVPGLFSSTGDSLALGTLALSPLQTAGLGLLMLALLAGYVASLVVSLRQDATIWYENPEGRVEISIGAVEDFVRRVAADFPEIKEISPTIRESKDGIKVVSRVAVWTGSTIPALTQRLQHDIKEKIQNVLGIADVSSVEVNIAKIQSREAARATAHTEASEDSAPIGVPNQ